MVDELGLGVKGERVSIAGTTEYSLQICELGRPREPSTMGTYSSFGVALCSIDP